VRANRLNDGTFEAIEIEIETPNTPTPAKVTITGMVESKHSDTLWYIGGRRVRKDDRTKIEGELRIGAFAEVEGVQESPTTVFAHRITVIRACEHPTPFEGVILAIDADSGTWTVQVVVNRDGQDVQDQYTVVVDSDTQVQGTPAIGLVVQVEACWTGGNTYVAQRIFVVPTPTPTDTPAATPTPELPSLQSTPTLGLGATVTPSPEAHETQQTPTVEPSPVTTSTPVLNDATATATP